ncbi:TonB-dependent receptor [Natronoflexus pectinivorans]|uniref:Iron complex outermembrane receptor protein n=1 Tax=Natronoflexus pectinivorans TaxID=682526 RepID=A0A4R2GC12_9BACT|nr:TonB-dependent receptor [Natronoflexus pectinivorans]TCO05413.1 iron complex outermembrane receptor protein [Natronoflexus pectinivorans]
MILRSGKIFILLLLLFCNSVYGSNYGLSVKGVVLDENNNPVPGANVVYNGGTMGVVTDGQGVFEINNLPIEKQELVASSMGYEAVTYELDGHSDESFITLRLKSSDFILNEVQVVSSQRDNRRRSESTAVEVINQDFLFNNYSGSLMQTLQRVPGVSSMDVGTGISKPVIRGLGFYRVVVAENGIKHEGQQWNSHSGLSIDQQGIHQIEIIKGPASLQYGSDAIGGVINILPAPIPQNGEISGNVSLTGKTNTAWMGGSASVSGRNGDFYFHTGFTHNSFGDFKIPETDEFILPAPVSAAEASHRVPLGNQVYNTAGRENAVSLTTGLVKSWGTSYFDMSYYSNKTGFFDYVGLQYEDQRADHAKNRRDIRVPYQKVDNYSLNHFTNVALGENRLQMALGYQYNESAEHSFLFDRTGNRYEDLIYYREKDNLELLLKLHNVSANFLYSIRSIENHTIDFVLNSQYHYHTTDGYNHILPHYNRTSIGAGVLYKYEFSPQWLFNAGARADFNRFEMEQSLNPDPAYGDAVFNPDFNKNFNGSSFSVGVNHLPDNNTIWKLHVGKSYRVPSAYELGAYGLHRHEGRFERGDLNISPEQAWQFDAGLDKRIGDFEFSVSPFVNYFTNYLFLNPTPELRPEGQVYEYRQTEALLTGGEISLDYMWRRFQFNASAEYVYAVNLELERPLPFTPPFSAIVGVNYQLNDGNVFKRSSIGLEALTVADQNMTVPNELNTPGYRIYNFNARTTVAFGRQEVNMRLTVRNLLDEQYFNHISFYRRMRIPEPGRDVQLFVNIPF